MPWLQGLLATATTAACTAPECARRLYAHMLALLVSPCRGTITNLICLGGRAQQDWTADYRLYSRDRVDPDRLFRHGLLELHAQLPPEAALVTAIDDTLVRKTGTKIHGVGWKRDPLGPAFQTNLVRGQRFVQLSAAWPCGPAGQARMIPIDFTHAPTPPKPPKRAGAAEHQQYKEQQKQQRLNVVALARIHHLRQTLPASRRLVVAGDGSYTNAAILKGLPENTVYLGRIRKDAVLHALPGPPPATGRPPSYGPQSQTPEELRTDDTVAWQAVEAFAAGQRHTFKIKTLGPILWRKSGADCPLRVVVIAPIGYRLRQGSRLLYRQPAFLICTDPDKPLEEVLQEYLWRWGIEVNFRDEKTLIGTGEAQVRDPASNRNQPAVTVAAYALLWIAALKLMKTGAAPPHLQPPKWRAAQRDCARPELATGELLRALRCELWAPQLSAPSFSHFTSPPPADDNTQQPVPSLPHTLLSAA